VRDIHSYSEETKSAFDSGQSLLCEYLRDKSLSVLPYPYHFYSFSLQSKIYRIVVQILRKKLVCKLVLDKEYLFYMLNLGYFGNWKSKDFFIKLYLCSTKKIEFQRVKIILWMIHIVCQRRVNSRKWYYNCNITLLYD